MRQNATIAEVCAYFADGLTDTEPRDFVARHSVSIHRDTITSYGSHFPMAKIIRDSRGRAKRLVINTDHYASRGFSSTSSHQHAVLNAVQAKAQGGTDLAKILTTYRLGRGEIIVPDSETGRAIRIDVLRVPLTSYAGDGRVFAVEDPNDPEPPEEWANARREVPAPFHAYDPGPPPKDEHPEQCIAGTREEYEFQEESHVYGDILDRRPYGAVMRVTKHDSSFGPRRAWVYWRTGILEYGRERYRYGDPQNTTYKQCPHCAEFLARYERWRYSFYGSYYTSNVGKGYKLYSHYMTRFGSEKAWREEGRKSYREAKRRRAARADWLDRNTLPFVEVPKRNGIPVLDSDGKASRTALEKFQRALRRRKRERAREDERQAKLAAEREKQYQIEREERARQFKEARERWESGLEFDVPDEVARWCVNSGVPPQPSGTVALVKAVNDDYSSGWGGLYEPDSNVMDETFDPTPACGGGLHFSATPRQASHWARGPVHRYVRVEVPLCHLVIIDATKVKAPYCYVERELTEDEIATLNAGQQW
jgi:hypothetical protein